MNIFEGRLWKYSSAALYIFLAFLSFYCACYRLPVSVKYAINLVIFGLACLSFFVHPQFDHAVFCLRFFILFFFPYLMFWIWSVGIWISEFQTFDFILRGSLNIIYMFTNLLYVCGAVYLFGKNVIVYTLIGMIMANGFVAIQVAASSSIAGFIQEYITLLTTFADETGGIMHQMELHDMVYGWGVLVVYYFIHKEKSRLEQIVFLLISSFFFTLGFKRIAIPAVVGAVALFYFLKHLKPKHLHALSTVIAILAGCCLFLYLYSIKSHIFFDLADKYGIDLMSRDVLYQYYENFYELSPKYLGRGIRFIYAYGTEHKTDAIMVDAVHNGYLEFYIETGFWCWWIWILYELAFRIHRISSWYSDVPAYAMMAMNFYVFFTYLTDNTSFYYPINVLYRMVIMVWCLEISDRRASQIKLFSDLDSYSLDEFD